MGSLHLFIEKLGLRFIFVGEAFASIFTPKIRLKLILDQFEFIGNGSLFIILLTASFSGGVAALQTYYGMEKFNAETLVGPVVALATAREFAPVFSGLMVAGRAGAAMAAQIGTMRVSQQIDALEVMAVNSKNYLVGPRVIATMVAMPLLTGIYMLVGNFGSWIVGVKILRIESGLYFAKLDDFVGMPDIYQGLVKAVFFGAVLSLVGTWCGYTTTGGAQGVGQSTNRAVVTASVLILVFDYFLTPILRSWLWGI